MIADGAGVGHTLSSYVGMSVASSSSGVVWIR